MDNFIWLANLASLLLILNVILFFKGAFSKNKPLKIFVIYLVTILIIDGISAYVGKILHQPNLYLSHVYFISQFVLLSLLYEALLKSKWIIWIMVAVLLAFSIQYINSSSLIFEYNALGMSVTHTLIVVYSVIYFYQSLKAKGELLIVNTGLFLYLLSSTLIFASGNLILKLNLPDNTQYLLININRILYVVFQVLIFVEWYKNYRFIRVNKN